MEVRPRGGQTRHRMKIDHLPDDSLYEILGHLNTKRDIENVLIVSKKWFSVVHKLKFAWNLFEDDAKKLEILAMRNLKERMSQKFDLTTAIRGFSQEERRAFKNLENAYKYYGLARNQEEKKNLAIFAYNHPLFPLLGSPEFKTVIKAKIEQMEKTNGGFTSKQIEQFASVFVLLGIFFILYNMVNNI